MTDSLDFTEPFTYHSIQDAQLAYCLENPHVSFGPLIQENSTVFPFRFSFTKGQTYLLVDSMDPYNVFVQEATFTGFDLDDIYDEETGEYLTYNVYYNFQIKDPDREQDPDLIERCISGSCMSETETNTFIMAYTRIESW